MKYFYIITCLCCINSSFSQNDSIQTTQIDSIFIQAIRVQEPWQDTPMAITKLNVLKTQNIKQQLSLNDYLQSVPGLFVQNANNFSQDMRVSVRGFGSRSAFGIRGVKLLVDGIPETTPDGQGQIDNLNLSVLKTIEVIRGPSAALYGNASGGVISINTLDTVDSLLLKGAVTAGSFNFQRFQATTGFKAGRSSYILDANHTTTDGYRDQSGFSNTNVNARMISKICASIESRPAF